MKAAAFAFERPGTLAEASHRLRASDGARAIAGGQSLGPMLNFRIVRPTTLVALAGVAQLGGVAVDGDSVLIGAGVTHAQIAHALAPPVGEGAHAAILADIASAIAYPAVRNRGTVGGSLCHADPAADWVCTLTALGAEALTFRTRSDGAPAPGRALPVELFVRGAFTNALERGEILQAVRIPRLSADARWGYSKACRKPGEFAHAMAAVLDDPARGRRRIAVGAVGGRPLLLAGPAATLEAAEAAIRSAAAGLNRVEQQMQIVTLRRAAGSAGWP